jgi:hypothetical protein
MVELNTIMERYGTTSEMSAQAEKQLVKKLIDYLPADTSTRNRFKQRVCNGVLPSTIDEYYIELVKEAIDMQKSCIEAANCGMNFENNNSSLNNKKNYKNQQSNNKNAEKM